MDFLAVDVETANSDLSSICQIGVVSFSAGNVCESWGTYLDPKVEFAPFNVSLHGITEESVAGSPTFDQIYDKLIGLLNTQTVLCHTYFDRSAVNQAAERAGMSPIACHWVDTARVARVVWPELKEGRGGYGLASVASALGISFEHHDAVEDARACGEILVYALRETNPRISSWLTSLVDRERKDASLDTPLDGEIVVFTGALNMRRSDAKDIATKAGAKVTSSVSPKTTVVVVGDQIAANIGEDGKSSKQRKAEALAAKGQALRIIGEGAFLKAVGLGG